MVPISSNFQFIDEFLNIIWPYDPNFMAHFSEISRCQQEVIWIPCRSRSWKVKARSFSRALARFIAFHKQNSDDLIYIYIIYMVPCPVFPPPHGMGGYDAPVVVYIHTYIPTYLPTYILTYIHTYIPLHYLTLHYLTLHSIHTYIHTITLHYLTLPYLTLHYITLPYLTFHTYIHTITLPYLTLPYLTFHTYIHTYIHIQTHTHTYIHTYIHTNIPTYHHHRPQGGGTRRTRRYCPPIPIGGGGEGGWPTLHHIYIYISQVILSDFMTFSESICHSYSCTELGCT